MTTTTDHVLVAHSMQMRWGAMFESKLSRREDETFKLDLISDHADFADETFILSSDEANEWMEHMDGREW